VHTVAAFTDSVERLIEYAKVFEVKRSVFARIHFAILPLGDHAIVDKTSKIWLEVHRSCGTGHDFEKLLAGQWLAEGRRERIGFYVC
jgi:hypothetical protein